MLVLSRKIDEDVVMVFNGQQIVIKTLGILGDKVRLGFDAPQQVVIHRREVLDRIRQEQADSPAA